MKRARGYARWTSVALGVITALCARPSWAEEKKEAADVRYARVSTPLFASHKGKVMGRSPPGTPFEVKKRRGGRTQVILEGWSRDYSPLRLVGDPTTMLPRATLLRIPEGARTVVENRVDTYDARWQRVRVTAWVPTAKLAQDARPIWKAAIELQQTRCTVCHEFKPSNRLTASQWRGTLVIMSHRAALTPEEEALLSQYLQTHAEDAP